MKEFKKKIAYIILTIVGIIIINSCNNNQKQSLTNFPLLSGPFLGQTLPNDDPIIFAPNIVSTAMYTRDITMTPDGNEIYFCISVMGYNLIYFTKQIDNVWTEPKIAPFITELDKIYYEPHITPNGSRMLFLTSLSDNESEEVTQNIWAVDRLGETWSTPYNLGAPINTDGTEYFPSTTREGTLYFTRAKKGSRIHYIYRSKLVDGQYIEPEKLNDSVNCGTNRYNAFIDPDERFIIVSVVGMEDGLGGTDYYIVFRDEKDNWSKPINLGPKINQKLGAEWSPYVSPDGKYFFFMSTRTKEFNGLVEGFPTFTDLLNYSNKLGNGNPSIYWVKSDFLHELQY